MFMKTENGSKADDHANERYKFGAQPHQAFIAYFCPDPAQDAIKRCPSRQFLKPTSKYEIQSDKISGNLQHSCEKMRVNEVHGKVSSL